MTEKLEELLKIIEEIDIKIITFSVKRSFGDESHYRPYNKSPANYFSCLVKELEKELNWLENVFFIDKKSALVLALIISLYIKHDGIKTNFIKFADIEGELNWYLNSHFIFVLKEILYDLEYKEIITIKEVDHYLVRIFTRTGGRQNDYYLLPAKPSFVPFANRKFELSDSFINKLNNL